MVGVNICIYMYLSLNDNCTIYLKFLKGKKRCGIIRIFCVSRGLLKDIKLFNIRISMYVNAFSLVDYSLFSPNLHVHVLALLSLHHIFAGWVRLRIMLRLTIFKASEGCCPFQRTGQALIFSDSHINVSCMPSSFILNDQKLLHLWNLYKN